MDKLDEEKRKRRNEKRDVDVHDEYVEEKKYWMDKKLKAFNKKQESGSLTGKEGETEQSYIFPTIASCTSSGEEEEENIRKEIVERRDEKMDSHHHHRRHHHRKHHHRSHYHSK